METTYNARLVAFDYQSATDSYILREVRVYEPSDVKAIIGTDKSDTKTLNISLDRYMAIYANPDATDKDNAKSVVVKDCTGKLFAFSGTFVVGESVRTDLTENELAALQILLAAGDDYAQGILGNRQPTFTFRDISADGLQYVLDRLEVICIENAKELLETIRNREAEEDGTE